MATTKKPIAESEEITEITAAQQTRLAALKELGQDLIKANKAYAAAKQAGNADRAEKLKAMISKIAAQKNRLAPLGEDDESTSVDEGTTEKLLRRFVPGQANKQIGSKIKDQQFDQIMAIDGDKSPENDAAIARSKRNIKRLNAVGKDNQVEEGQINEWAGSDVQYFVYLFGKDGNFTEEPSSYDNRSDAITYACDMPSIGYVVVGVNRYTDKVKVIRSDFDVDVERAQELAFKMKALEHMKQNFDALTNKNPDTDLEEGAKGKAFTFNDCIAAVSAIVEPHGFSIKGRGRTTVIWVNDQTKGFVEIELSVEDPKWVGWAEGRVGKNDKLNYGSSGNDPIEHIPGSIASLFEDDEDQDEGYGGGDTEPLGWQQDNIEEETMTNEPGLDEARDSGYGDMSKPYGVRWTAFAGREGRQVNKQKFFGTQAQMDKFTDKLVLTDGFYQIDSWCFPREEEKVTEGEEGAGEQFHVYHKIKGDRMGGPDYDFEKSFPTKETADEYVAKQGKQKNSFHSKIVVNDKRHARLQKQLANESEVREIGPNEGVDDSNDAASYEYDPAKLVQLATAYSPKSGAGREVKRFLDDPEALPYSIDDVIALIDEAYYEALENGIEGPRYPEELADLKFFQQAVKKCRGAKVTEASYAKKGVGNGKDSSPANINIGAVPGSDEHTISHWTGKKHIPLSKANGWDAAVQAAHKHSKELGVPLDRDLRGTKVDEAFKKENPNSQERTDRSRAGVRIKTPEGVGVIVAEYKVPTFSATVPFKRTVRVKLEDGKTKEFDYKACKVSKLATESEPTFGEPVEEGLISANKLSDEEIQSLIPPDEFESKKLSEKTESLLLTTMRQRNVGLTGALARVKQFKRDNGFKNNNLLGGMASMFGEDATDRTRSKTVYPNATVIKTKKGREVGEIYKEEGKEFPWGCFHYGEDGGDHGMASREEALDCLREMHDSYVQNRTGGMKSGAEFKPVAEGNEGVDQVCMTVPLFIRCLEWAKESAPDDIALHQFTENIVAQDGCLDVEDYEGLIPAGDEAEPVDESEETGRPADANFMKWVRANKPGVIQSKDPAAWTQANKDYARSLRNKYKDITPDATDVDPVDEGIVDRFKRGRQAERRAGEEWQKAIDADKAGGAGSKEGDKHFNNSRRFSNLLRTDKGKMMNTEGVEAGQADQTPVTYEGRTIGHIELDDDGDLMGVVYSNNPQSKRPWELYGHTDEQSLKAEMIDLFNKKGRAGLGKVSEETEQVDEISDAAAKRLLQARMNNAWSARDKAADINSTEDDINAAGEADDKKFGAFNAVGKRAQRKYGPQLGMREGTSQIKFGSDDNGWYYVDGHGDKTGGYESKAAAVAAARDAGLYEDASCGGTSSGSVATGAVGGKKRPKDSIFAGKENEGEVVTELDNGPGGRVKTDKINYDYTRNSTGGIPSDELAQRKADQIGWRDDVAAQKKREKEWAKALMPQKEVKPKRLTPKPRVAHFKSDQARSPLEQKAKDAMFQVWQAIAPDIRSAWGADSEEVEDELSDPYTVAEWCYDANRLTEFGDLTQEEEDEILNKLSRRTLARLASNFGI